MIYPKITFKEADKLLDKLKAQFRELGLVGNVVTGDVFNSICYQLSKGMSTDAHYIDPRLFESVVSHVAGKKLTFDSLDFLLEFVSVNREAYRAGNAITIPSRDGGVPKAPQCCRVVGVERTDNPRKPYLYTVKISWGRYYGIRTTIPMSMPQVATIGRRIGVTGKRDPGALPKEMVGMFMFVFFDSGALGEAADFRVKEIRANNYLSTINRNISKARQTPCPLSKPLPCTNCKVGMDLCFRSAQEHTEPGTIL